MGLWERSALRGTLLRKGAAGRGDIASAVACDAAGTEPRLEKRPRLGP